jgi:hypothetical protein
MSIYGNPVQVLIDRLTFQADKTATGRILTGWTFYPMPTEHPDGQQDFPWTQLWLPDIDEVYHARLLGQGTVVLKLSVSTARAAGVPALVDGLAAVMNAIETDHLTGNIGTHLSGTLISPLEMRSTNGWASPLALNGAVMVTLKPKLFTRGER